MREEQTEQEEADAGLSEIIKQISPLMPNMMGPLMLELHIRQAILQCLSLLPEEERSAERVEQEIQRRLHGALNDLRTGQATAICAGSTKQRRPAGEDRLAQIRAKYAKAYEPWTAEDDCALRHEQEKGSSIARLSDLFQRQPSAIRSRLLKLGIAQATGGR